MTLPIEQKDSMKDIIAFLEQSPNKAEFLEALKKMRIDEIKRIVKDKVKQEKFKREKVLKNFLDDRQKSERTIKSYKQEIGKFFDWIDNKSIHLLEVKRVDINKYIVYMGKKGFSNNTQRLGLAALSSLFRYMEAEEQINKSPFIQIKYPKKVYKKAVRTDQQQTIPVMNENEYQAIMEELETRANRKGNRLCDIRAREAATALIPIISLMAAYGLRIGSIAGIEINKQESYFSTISKGGKVLTFDLTPEIVAALKKYKCWKKQPFEQVKPVNIHMVLKRITQRLKEEDKIRYAYTAHDFRHHFAHNHYRENKDIVALSRMLGHASINVTDIYLQSVGVQNVL